MNKVICDICGTSYPETAEQCPICGYSRDAHIEPLADGEDFLLDENFDFAEEAEKGGIFTEANVRKRNADELDTESENEDEDADAEDEEEEKRRPSALLIVLLVIVIVALLAVAGYIFVKYYLPGMSTDETVPETTAAVETMETTVPAVPCTSLAMTSDSQVTLEQPGNNWLINVVAMPEDTTDVVTFVSSDESVVTVSQSGTVTAVGEGEAVITVTCGEFQVTCDVVCAFVEESSVPDVTQAPTEAPTEAATENGSEAASEAETEAPTEAATEAPTEAATEAPTEAPTEAATEPATDLVLKLNKKDISFDRVGVYYTLKVTDGIDPTEVEWTSSHGGVCVVKDGVVTITGAGMAKVTAKWQGQEASCLVRVSLSGN